MEKPGSGEIRGVFAGLNDVPDSWKKYVSRSHWKQITRSDNSVLTSPRNGPCDVGFESTVPAFLQYIDVGCHHRLNDSPLTYLFIAPLPRLQIIDAMSTHIHLLFRVHLLAPRTEPPA